jgi:NitT/TauT family transport system substrate-binding protein
MRLRIGHLSTLYHTALIIQGLGLLDEKGVKAGWRLFGGGPAIVEALKRDELDIGYVGLPPAMIGISEGARVKCVAGGHVEGTVICTTMSGQVGGVEEVIRGVAGLRIGSPPRGSIHDIIIRFLLEKFNVKAEVVNYPWADFIPLAWERGEVSAAVGTPALGVFLKYELDAEIALRPSRIWPFNPSYGIIAREEFISEEALNVFLGIHEDACNVTINNPRRTAEIAADVLGFVSSDFALKVIRLSPRYCASLPPDYIDSTMDFVPVMLDLGYLSEPLVMGDIEEIHPKKDHYHAPLKV